MTDDVRALLEKIANLESEIKMIERDLIHDPLTGLKTRAFFEEELNHYLIAIFSEEGSKRKEWFGFKNVSVLFFDIDDFKKVNDTYGHEAGDSVLSAVAQAINESVREGDTVARWGGEELVAVLLGSSEEDAQKKAEEICTKVAALPFDFAQKFGVTVSIGVAYAYEKMLGETLVKHADEAMYAAKTSGKNKVVAYSEIKK